MKLSSRYWIRLMLPVGMAVMYFAVKVHSEPASLKPFSVQMHLHGSMSEGPGSMRGANVQAKKIGLDVLWWTDHDWRIAYHSYADGYDFEADGLSATRPVPYPPGTDLKLVEGEEMQVDLTPHPGNAKVVDPIARITAETASQGSKSLEIAATSSGKIAASKGPDIPDPNDDGEGRPRGKKAAAVIGDYQSYFYTIDASRRRMKRSLASRVTLDISIWPDFDATSDSMAGLRIDLSQQPPDMQQGSLFYVLTGKSAAALKPLETASRKFVPLTFKPRQWNHYKLNLTEDAERLNLGGTDNSLVDASFGVLSRGARTRALFDDYHITHQIKSEELRAEERRMAAHLEKEFGTTNYVSQELSYQAHLNPFGEHVQMIDYIKNPLGLNPRETVDFVHANGGVVSVNHIFGTSRAPKGVDVDDPVQARKYEEKRQQNLLNERMYGADILEVGYPVRVLPMTSFLRVWDSLSRAGIYVMADGVSDTHTSNGGWFSGNNFVTWIWASSKSIPDLVDGLHRGAAYFGDPQLFHGRLQLTTDDGHRMGQVAVGKKASHNVLISIEGLPAGAKVRAVTAGQYSGDFAGAGPTFSRSVAVDTRSATFFRVEVYTAENKPLVFSNAIYFTPNDGEKIDAYKRTACK